jgi:hypothetical protein
MLRVPISDKTGGEILRDRLDHNQSDFSMPTLCPNSSTLINYQATLPSLSAVVYTPENIARQTTLHASHQKRHYTEQPAPEPRQEVNAIALHTLYLSIWHRSCTWMTTPKTNLLYIPWPIISLYLTSPFSWPFLLLYLSLLWTRN